MSGARANQLCSKSKKPYWRVFCPSTVINDQSLEGRTAYKRHSVGPLHSYHHCWCSIAHFQKYIAFDRQQSRTIQVDEAQHRIKSIELASGHRTNILQHSYVVYTCNGVCKTEMRWYLTANSDVISSLQHVTFSRKAGVLLFFLSHDNADFQKVLSIVLNTVEDLNCFYDLKAIKLELQLWCSSITISFLIFWLLYYICSL